MKPVIGPLLPIVKDKGNSEPSEHQCQNCHRMIPETEEICDTCKQNGVTPMKITQASIWRKNKCSKCQQIIFGEETLCVSCSVQQQEQWKLPPAQLPIGWTSKHDP